MRLAVLLRSGLVAALLAAPAGAEVTSLSADPALPTAGGALRILSSLGKAPGFWCYFHQGGTEILPGVVKVHVLDATPPIDPVPPCGSPPGTDLPLSSFVWEVPTGVLTAGPWTVELMMSNAGNPGVEWGAEILPVSVQTGAAELTLHHGEFVATIAWRDPLRGDHGTAHGVPLSSESGMFWFFSDRNVEVTLKLLDATAVNGHFWLFVASQTSLEFTLTIVRNTDSCSALPDPPAACPQRQWTHPAGVPQNFQDLEAFPSQQP